MPTEKHSSIGMIEPSGWQTGKYDIVEGKYLYNCYLQNCNEKSHLNFAKSSGILSNKKFDISDKKTNPCLLAKIRLL